MSRQYVWGIPLAAIDSALAPSLVEEGRSSLVIPALTVFCTWLLLDVSTNPTSPTF